MKMVAKADSKISKILDGDIDKTYERLGENIQSLKDSIEYYQEKLRTYSKAEEIQKMSDTVTTIRNNALLIMTDQEREAMKQFLSEHREKCLPKRRNTSGFWYQLTGTGIGTVITIKCPICGEEKDITDYESW